MVVCLVIVAWLPAEVCTGKWKHLWSTEVGSRRVRAFYDVLIAMGGGTVSKPSKGGSQLVVFCKNSLTSNSTIPFYRGFCSLSLFAGN